MIKSAPSYVTFPLFVFVSLSFLVIFFVTWSQNDHRLRDAEQAYIAAENAETIYERQEKFNEALSLYQDLEKEYRPEYGTGRLYFNVANTYFQLGQYPKAILYYYKAHSLMPREAKVQRNLNVALSKLNLSPVHLESYASISLPERLQAFFILTCLSIALASLMLWSPSRLCKWGLILSLFLATVTLMSILYTRYISPLEGVILTSTDLYKDAGTQYAKVSPQPLASGTKVEILQITPNNKWLKIITSEGEFGYIPATSTGLIGL